MHAFHEVSVGFVARRLLVLLALFAASFGSLPGAARDLREVTTYDFATVSEGAPYADYFRENAWVGFGTDKELPNGVSWRLLVDAETGVSLPRLNWLPNRQALLTANRMLDMVHGKLVQDAVQIRVGWDEILDRQPQPFWYFSIHDVLKLDDVELTYASDRFVSFRAFGRVQWDYTSEASAPVVKGQVLDLVRQTFFGVEACSGEKFRYGMTSKDLAGAPVLTLKEHEGPGPRQFVFGDLLRLCDETRYAAFRALVIKSALALIAESESVASRVAPQCADWARELVTADFPVVPILTVTGLALHDFRQVRAFLPFQCPTTPRGREPVVIPYRELAPLMTPGLLKDELLNLR